MNRSALRALILVVVAALALAAGCGWTKKITTYYEDYMGSRDTNLGKRVCVAEFTSGLPEMDARAQAWRQGLLTRLKADTGLVIVPFSQLEEAMKPLADKVRDREERAILAGRRLGITALVAGQLTDLSVQRQLTGIYGMRDNKPFLGMEGELRVLDVATGAVAGQKSFRPHEELTDIQAEDIRMGAKPKPEQVDRLAGLLAGESQDWIMGRVNAIPWVGFVLKVEGDKALITASKDTGLAQGSQLYIYALGERIVTGEGTVLHLMGHRMATATLAEVGDNSSWAQFTLETLPKEEEEKEPPKKEEVKKEGEESKADKMDMRETPHMPTKPKAFRVTPGMMVRTY